MSDRPHITADFETRSASDLKKVGSWQYSRHPTTRPLCFSWALGDEEPRTWVAGFPELGRPEDPPPTELFDLIAQGYVIEAHNAFFERSIWKNVMALLYGWPEVPDDQWDCSAAKASAAALPRSLDELCKALGVDELKDKVGQRALMRMCKPKKPNKAERQQLQSQGIDPKEHVLWHVTAEDLETVISYNRQDVRSERAASKRIPALSPKERRLWLLDQRMNERGIYCDVDMARTAIAMADESKARMNEELKQITGGDFKASQRAAVKEWLATSEGVELPDTKAATLDEWIEEDDEAEARTLGTHLQRNMNLFPKARRVIEILRSANRTSTKKYEAMLARADVQDWRLRDIAMFSGANTGRWTGKGIQPHNFPRGGIVELPGGRKSGFKDMDAACETILHGDVDFAEMLYGDVMDLLSDALRGALTAAPGKVLTVGDFAAIEARVVFWLANCRAALGVFERGEDIYIDMAQRAYRRKLNKKDNPNERQMGKQSILGLGFGMGFPKFLITCRGYGLVFSREFVLSIVPDYPRLVEEVLEHDRRYKSVSRYEELDIERDMHELVFMKYIVDLYRGDYPEVPEFWRDLNDAAMAAVIQPGRVTAAGRIADPDTGGMRPAVKYKVVGPRLYCKLPSGRSLIYNRPAVVKETKALVDGEVPDERPKLRYWGVDQKTKKWSYQWTYGGKLCENVVQATARDLLAEAMVEADDRGWNPVMTVHDELVVETDPGVLTPHDLEEVMSYVPAWATGCPVAAEAWQGERYRK